MIEEAAPFAHDASFQPAETQEGVHLGRLEAQYEELFAEVIEDGIITAEERAKLEQKAGELGIDRERLVQLERALTGAYEARRRVRVREIATETAPSAPAADGVARAEELLARRVAELEARIAELELEIEDLRAQASIDVDVSGVASSATPVTDVADPEELIRRLRPDPRDGELLRALFRTFVKRGEIDRAWCTAHVLTFVGAADADARELYDKLRGEGLVRPRAALSREAWHRLLVHPDQEPLVGEIFAAVLGPVLLGRIAALRRDGALPKLDPAQRHDPATSTITAVRCFGWAASLLAVQLPPLFADPSVPETARMIPATQPALRIGQKALSGRTPAELAFLAGEHLAYFRDDAFMRALVDAITDLEDLFLAALSIGHPGLPLAANVRARVAPIAAAVEPLLGPVQKDRLRAAFLRFVEEGGRTNLLRWAESSDATAARAGLLTSNDLAAAEAVLKIEDPARLEERMNDLLLFTVGERYAKLRKEIGIAVT